LNSFLVDENAEEASPEGRCLPNDHEQGEGQESNTEHDGCKVSLAKEGPAKKPEIPALDLLRAEGIAAFECQLDSINEAVVYVLEKHEFNGTERHLCI